MSQEFEERITGLELRYMQQELVIQELNDALYRQEQVITRLERDLAGLAELSRSASAVSAAMPDEDERPPHY